MIVNLKDKIMNITTHKNLSENTKSFINELFSLKSSEFIEHAYRHILKREPDATGSEYYLEKLNAGYSNMYVIKQLINSSEYKKLADNFGISPTALDMLLGVDDNDFIIYVYKFILNRDVDIEGLSFYTNKLKKGSSKISIITEIYRSAESKNKSRILKREFKLLLFMYNFMNAPVARHVFSSNNYSFDDSILSRKLRIIENNLRTNILNCRETINNIESIKSTINSLKNSAINCDNFDKKSFVKMSYQLLLKRDPEDGAIESTIPRFNNKFGPADFLLEVSLSEEYKTLNSQVARYRESSNIVITKSNHQYIDKENNSRLTIQQILNRINNELGSCNG